MDKQTEIIVNELISQTNQRIIERILRQKETVEIYGMLANIKKSMASANEELKDVKEQFGELKSLCGIDFGTSRGGDAAANPKDSFTSLIGDLFFGGFKNGK